MPPPLAYFLTWTTYGTRLHGDERGSVDLAHNVPSMFHLPPDPVREDEARVRMTDAPYLLGREERLEVGQAIRDHCDLRGWVRHEHNVRSNHAHVVVTAPTHSPAQAMAQLKSWGTRRLVAAGLVPRGRRVWTDHGSTVWINDRESLERVILYVREMQ